MSIAHNAGSFGSDTSEPWDFVSRSFFFCGGTLFLGALLDAAFFGCGHFGSVFLTKAGFGGILCASRNTSQGSLFGCYRNICDHSGLKRGDKWRNLITGASETGLSSAGTEILSAGTCAVAFASGWWLAGGGTWTSLEATTSWFAGIFSLLVILE